MIEKEIRDNILVIRLNRPEKLNAWDTPAREAFRSALEEADANDDVKAVIVTGTGERAFCAGADLKESGIGVPSDARQRMDRFLNLYTAVLSFRKPLIAALNGLAVGSAFQVVLLMDYRVGHPGVQVGLTEINSGIPTISGATILNWAVGLNRTRELSVSGRMVAGDEAHALGLIEELTDADKVMERAFDAARRLCAKKPHAYAETKAWLRDLRLPELSASFERAFEIRQRKDVASSIQSGVAGFVAKN
ncbi:enoyl-CoA hydratase/isomerase family protein [Paraburkholderia sp.]|uniref:enoyl-CoA hydratase/isomerase family protein n=1 Tax=Paraburkholderia sp. TaxID=1926495 RepID=UPI0039E5D598